MDGRHAGKNRETTAEQGKIFHAQGEPAPQSAKLILPDGSEYQGRIVSGNNKRSFQTDRRKLTLVFEISHIDTGNPGINTDEAGIKEIPT
jgi:hypothetical protein